LIVKQVRLLQRRNLLLDSIVLLAADVLGVIIRFEGMIPEGLLASTLVTAAFAVPMRVVVLAMFGMYQRLWEYATVRDLAAVACGVSGAYLVALVLVALTPLAWSRGSALVSYMLAMSMIGFSRFNTRISAELINNKNGNGQTRPARASITSVLIAGAGSAGSMVAKELAAHPEMARRVIGFVDDDPVKRDSVLCSLPVLGSLTDIPELVKEHHIDEVIVAMPSVPGRTIRGVVDSCKPLKVRIRTLPGVYELVDGKVSIKQLRDIEIEDLLGREPVHLDMESIGAYLTGATVLITGAGGSIGSEICRQITRFKPKSIVLLGHGENSIFEIQQELKRKYPSQSTVAVIADIRNEERIDKIFGLHKPDVVFHAAAHKHVPLMEENPEEALTNNVFGTRNVARAADKHGVKRFVMISTDKAVNPVSVMGMSKRTAEMVVQSIGANSKTKFMAVRFGNVLGSRGSVVPTFRKQIAEGGPVTVTHPDMTRYFMTIPEAVQLVIQAGAMGNGGEVFVLDMGEPVKITQLAEDIIRLSGLEPGKDIEIVYTGVRPGEKMYEEILTTEERAVATKHSKIFVSRDSTAQMDGIVAALEDMAGRSVAHDLGRSIVPYLMEAHGVEVTTCVTE
jgi:FlaA1/EpsC-like NDP-sugar epimerase